MPWQSICKEISSGVTRRICESDRISYAAIFEIENLSTYLFASHLQMCATHIETKWFCPTCWIPIINLHLPVESGGWGVDQTDTPWKMNGRNLQQLPIWKWSSEPNLREGMFHLNLHGCTTVPGESNEFGSIFPSKCPRWASWESTVDLFPPHRNRSGETYNPAKINMDTQNDGLETVTPLKKWSCFGIYVAFPGVYPHVFEGGVWAWWNIKVCFDSAKKTSMKSRYYNMPPLHK